MSEDTELFFVAYGGGHINLLLPVVKLAIAEGFDVKLLAMTTAGNVARQAGIEALGFADLLRFAAPGAHDYGVMLCRGIAEDGPVPIAESIAYHGINFAELAANLGEHDALRLYKQRGRHAFFPKQFFLRLLASIKPDVVVATNSPRSERAVITAAGELGIPSLCAVDLFALQEINWIGKKGYADMVCVLNESVYAMFVKHGCNPESVVVTGNPAFEKLVTPEARAGGHFLRNKRDWMDGRRTILWASQEEPALHPFNGMSGDPALPRKIEDCLRNFVKQEDGWRLVVRYHPSEQISFLEGHNVEFSPQAERLEHLLNAVDIVVVTASTVGLEAAIVGIPVVSIDTSIWTPDTLFANQGISTGIKSINQLPGALMQLGNQLESNLAVNSTIRMPDRPAEAILNQIVKLMVGKRRYERAVRPRF